MDFTAVCRMCLGNKLLTPIFPNTVDHNRYSVTIFVTTGIKVSLNDGLPQQMCAHCVYNLNNSFKFRKRCKDTEIKLLQVNQESKVNLGIKVEVTDASTNNEEYIEFHEDLKIELKCEKEDTAINKQEKERPKKVTNMEPEIDNELDDTNENTKGQDPLYQATAHRKDPKARVQCPLCNKDLSVRSMNTHMLKIHPGSDDRREKCKLCDRQLVRDKMNRHMILKHGSKDFKCRYCGTVFENHSQEQEHAARCAVRKDVKKDNRTRSRELVECDICQKKMQRASLRIHVRIKHTGLRPVCEHCGRRFGNKLRLDDHLRAYHGRERFRCGCCEFTAANKTSLVNHERRHRGEKPFVCEACGAKFHAPYLLAQHRQSHRTERNLKCGACGASFRTSNGLQAHRATRHGAAAHRCAVCARAYSCRHYAVKHMRAVHGFQGPVPALQVVKKSSET